MSEPTRKKPFPSWPVYDDAERRYLEEVLTSGKWCVSEYEDRSLSKVGQFEKEFAKYHEAEYGLAVANGTAALEIALKACGIGAGDEVIVPAYTFYSTASSVMQVNAVPVFVDVTPLSCCIDPDGIEAAITERTKAIIPVHFAGRSADMDYILDIAEKYSLAVIEDAAQAHGTTCKGKKVGALGDAGTFSFQASKNMSSGEGGIILTNNREIYEMCWSYHTLGRIKGGAWYEHHALGWNYRMTEFQAAVLLAQLERVEEQSLRREKNALYLTEKLSNIKGIYCPNKSPGRNAYHLYIIRVDAEEFGCDRDTLVKALEAEGVPVKTGYAFPLYKNPLFLNSAAAKTHCPVSEQMCRELIWLHHSMLLGEKQDMDDIAEAFVKIKETVGK